MSMRSGISKAQLGTDGVVPVRHRDYHTAHLCLTASLSQVITHKVHVTILHRLTVEVEISACVQKIHKNHKDAHTVSEVRDTDRMETLWKYTTTSFSLKLSTFMSLSLYLFKYYK